MCYNINIKKIGLFIAGFFLALMAIADEINFTAKANRNKVGTGETVQITYTINSNASNFKAPAFNGFKVIGGPNQSSSFQWVNGKTSQSLSISFILLAEKEGNYTFKGATIEAGGKTYTSNEITLEVVKGNPPQQQQQQAQPRQNPFFDPFDPFDNQPQQQTQTQNLKDDIYIKVNVDKKSVYLGEQITATYKIYTRVDIVSNSVKKLPALNGFWSQDIDNNGQAQLVKETVDGVPYYVAELKKTILFPQRTGTLEIDPIEMDVVLRLRTNNRSRSIFDQFFGSYQDVAYTVKSKPIKIEVKALPEKSKPVDFTGAVGKFQIESKINKTKLKANEAITLSYILSGKGNIKLIETPKPQFPSEIESYEPKVKDNINLSAAGVSGNRTFEYLLIPRYPGIYTIEGLNFSYFDPTTGKYENLKTEDLVIEVEKGDNEEAIVSSGIAKQDIQVLGSDINFIKTQTILQQKKDYFIGSPLFYLLWLLPIIIFVATWIIRKQYLESLKDTAKVNFKQANKIATKHLAQAKKQMDANAANVFYEEVFKALYDYISFKLNIEKSQLNKESIRERLMGKNVSAESIQKLIDTLDQCEFARFAPSAAIPMQQIYNQAEQCINKLEEEIK
ncbi:MAG: aerotolerance-like protein [Bacteroidia bacterium]|nr:MAG: aerotolerance-like protein [Bacteroidia bacterium]